MVLAGLPHGQRGWGILRGQVAQNLLASGDVPRVAGGVKGSVAELSLSRHDATRNAVAQGLAHCDAASLLAGL